MALLCEDMQKNKEDGWKKFLERTQYEGNRNRKEMIRKTKEESEGKVSRRSSAVKWSQVTSNYLPQDLVIRSFVNRFIIAWISWILTMTRIFPPLILAPGIEHFCKQSNPILWKDCSSTLIFQLRSDTTLRSIGIFFKAHCEIRRVSLCTAGR